MKGLFITTVLPREEKTGGEVASQQIINALEDIGVDLNIMGYVRKEDEWKENKDEIIVKKIFIETEKAKIKKYIWLIKSIFKGVPYTVEKYMSKEYERVLQKVMNNEEYSLIFLDHAQVGFVLKFVPRDTEYCYVAHNVEEDMYRKLAYNKRNWLARKIYLREARLIGRMEENLVKLAKKVYVLSDLDKKYFSSVTDIGKITVLPLAPIYEAEKSKKLTGIETIPQKNVIRMIGTWSWEANRKGLEWFINDVYPFIDREKTIHIAGKGANWINKKGFQNIKYYGFVENAEEFLSNASVIIIPSTEGEGVQIKTLNAIATGRYVVATSKAVRGLENLPTNVFLADNPAEFARLANKYAGKEILNVVKEDVFQWMDKRKKEMKNILRKSTKE